MCLGLDRLSCPCLCPPAWVARGSGTLAAETQAALWSGTQAAPKVRSRSTSPANSTQPRPGKRQFKGRVHYSNIWAKLLDYGSLNIVL